MLLPETLRLHDRKRFEFHYAYFLPWKNQMVSALEAQGAKVTCFEARNNAAMFRQAGNIIRYCKDNNIDVIHAHLPWAGFVARYIHKKTGIPVIYTEHNKQERYHIATKLINKYTFNSQTLAVAVSDDVRASIIKNINPKIEVKTILNGVNTERFVRDGAVGKAMREKMGIPQDAIIVGTVAVFRFQKRLKEWLQVARKAADANANLRFVMIGDGPLKQEIEAERKRLGLEDYVLLPGLQEDTLPWYSMMDIFMMTSSFEGLPIALLEAMSMECAVVATRAGGIGEVVVDGESGVLVDVDEWERLSNLLVDLAGDRDMRDKLGISARDRVVEEFSLRGMCFELERAYDLTTETQRHRGN